MRSRKHVGLLAVAVAMSLAGTTFAESLITGTPNNLQRSIFLDFTAKASDLELTSFDTYFSNNQGSVLVYTRPGSYVGFTNSSEGWTLVDTIPITDFTARGSYNSTGSLVFSDGISIAAGQTMGMCLFLLDNADVNCINYTDGTAYGYSNTYGNDDLILFSGLARSAAFSGSIYEPRTFAGTVNYNLLTSSIPEPASLGLLAMGAAGLLLRRRK